MVCFAIFRYNKNMKNTEESRKFNQRIGKKIRELRTKQGLSQEACSNGGELTASFISNLERGISGLSTFNLLQLCEILKVSPNQLLMWDSEIDNEELRQSYLEVSKLPEEKQEVVISIIRVILKELEDEITLLSK